MIKEILVSLLLTASSPVMDDKGKCRIDWKEESLPYFAENGYKVEPVDKVTTKKLIMSAISDGVDSSLLKGAKVYFARKGTEKTGIGSFWIVDSHGCLVVRATMTLQEAMEIFGRGI